MEKKFSALLKEDDDKLVDAVLASAQQIWQAGLGAFAVAEQEGGKVFSRLVKEGGDMQKRTRRLAEIKVSGVTDTVSKMADNVGRQASGSWDKIEQVFEDRITRTLSSLGVPSNADIIKLRQRLDELSETVAELSSKKIGERKESGRLAMKSLEQPQAAAPKRATKAATKQSPQKPKRTIKSVAKKSAAPRRQPASAVAKTETSAFVSDPAGSAQPMQSQVVSADRQE